MIRVILFRFVVVESGVSFRLQIMLINVIWMNMDMDFHGTETKQQFL